MQGVISSPFPHLGVISSPFPHLGVISSPFPHLPPRPPSPHVPAGSTPLPLPSRACRYTMAGCLGRESTRLVSRSKFRT